jgi:hypothetical protein
VPEATTAIRREPSGVSKTAIAWTRPSVPKGSGASGAPVVSTSQTCGRVDPAVTSAVRPCASVNIVSAVTTPPGVPVTGSGGSATSVIRVKSTTPTGRCRADEEGFRSQITRLPCATASVTVPS